MKLKLPEFVYMSNKEEMPGVELLMQTQPPFHIMQVYFFRSEGDEMRFFTTNKQGYYANITGYRIYLVWQGTVTHKLPLTANTDTHIQDTLLKMTRYYEQHRIYKAPERYKRFQIGS